VVPKGIWTKGGSSFQSKQFGKRSKVSIPQIGWKGKGLILGQKGKAIPFPKVRPIMKTFGFQGKGGSGKNSLIFVKLFGVEKLFGVGLNTSFFQTFWENERTISFLLGN